MRTEILLLPVVSEVSRSRSLPDAASTQSLSETAKAALAELLAQAPAEPSTELSRAVALCARFARYAAVANC
jgi:hypothetical protein